MRTMRIFITGATGFLGNELLKDLHARGHEIAALIRSPERATGFPAGVRLVPGSIEDAASYRNALAGQDALVHVAAVVKMWARDRSEFDRVNVQGTEDILRAAADAGVGRLVYASSFMALGPSNGEPLAEDDARRTETWHNDYERTKHLADVRARSLIEEGLPLRVIYPGVIYGPGNLTHGNIIARNLVPFLNGRMPFGASIKTWSYAYVQDVVSGFVRIVEGDPPSRRYILGGDNRSGEEFYRALHAASGIRPPRFNVPPALATVAGLSEYALAELTGREPKLLTHEVARIYRRSWSYDSSRAIRELGYSITPLEEGLTRMVEWLRREGHVRRLP
jgi:farnesol dehydrogenase